jgi:hypothetical protein
MLVVKKKQLEVVYTIKNNSRIFGIVEWAKKKNQKEKRFCLKFRHAPAFAGAGSAKAGIQNYLKTLDSRLRAYAST